MIDYIQDIFYFGRINIISFLQKILDTQFNYPFSRNWLMHTQDILFSLLNNCLIHTTHYTLHTTHYNLGFIFLISLVSLVVYDKTCTCWFKQILLIYFSICAVKNLLLPYTLTYCCVQHVFWSLKSMFKQLSLIF